MKVSVPFGDTTIDAELPEGTFIAAMTPSKGIPPVENLEEAVREALANPLGLPPLKELAKAGSKVVIAFDDGTVPAFTPVRSVAIREVLAQLEAAGVDRDSVQLICANALHRKFRHEEMATWLGEDLVEEFGARLFCHDAEDKDNLVYLGQTENGYDVEISRYVMESDLTVYVNGSHNRGFNGGWKSVCVGLSTWRSIRRHHTPDGMSMSVKNNRMHIMLDEMGAFLETKLKGTIFKIDTLEANVFEVGKVVAGSVWETRKALMNVLGDMYTARRNLSDKKYDVVVYGVPNWSPYSAFSFMNPILTLISSGLGYLGGSSRPWGNRGVR